MTSTRDRLFGHSISLATLLLVLLGIWLCWLAFSVVRAAAFWLLFHFTDIAAIAATAFVLFVYWYIFTGREKR